MPDASSGTITAEMSLKAIFFDIDDTLFSTSEFADRARRGAVDAMRRYGLRLPADHILRELSEVISEFSSNYEHHFDKLLLRLPRRAFDGVNPAILVAAGVHAYHDAKVRQLRPYPDVPHALAKLAKTEMVRGIITAGLQQKQADKLLRLGLYEYFTPTDLEAQSEALPAGLRRGGRPAQGDGVRGRPSPPGHRSGQRPWNGDRARPPRPPCPGTREDQGGVRASKFQRTLDRPPQRL